MINKAIILTAGAGTRFLPLSKAVPKELMPLVDKPVLQYLLEEAMESGVTEVIFVVAPGKKKDIESYFKKAPKLEKLLKERKQEELLERVQRLEEIAQKMNFVFVTQKLPLGDGHAILQGRKFIQEPCAVFTNDDIIDAPVPCLSQMIQVFKTSQKPLLALTKVSADKLPYYGIVDAERISSRVNKIKKIVEKPKEGQAPSNFAIIGRYIIMPEVFDYLKKVTPNQKGEIILADALSAMILDGKMVYGYEINGRWLECGDISRWLQSMFYLSLKHPQYGAMLKKYLNEIIK